MSTTAFPARPRLHEDVKNLETILQRVSTLNTAITALYQTHASQFEPGRDLQLAPWPTIQHQTTIIEKRLSSLLEAVDEHQPLLNAAHAYPTGSFNARNPMHENILLQLIRKKMQPEVEDWVSEGVAAGERVSGATANQNGGGNGDMDVDVDGSGAGLSAAQYEELWDWAGPAGNDIARRIIEGAGEDEDEDDDDDDDEEGEDGDEDEEMEDAGTKDKSKGAAVSGPLNKPMMPLEQILRFAMTGGQT